MKNEEWSQMMPEKSASSGVWWARNGSEMRAAISCDVLQCHAWYGLIGMHFSWCFLIVLILLRILNYERIERVWHTLICMICIICMMCFDTFDGIWRSLILHVEHVLLEHVGAQGFFDVKYVKIYKICQGLSRHRYPKGNDPGWWLVDF